jgi:acyl-CoA synthetase (AMP-forming)/AMP-acid ligase II
MIFRSPYPEVTIPDTPLPSFVLQRADEFGDRPALIDGPSGRQLSYRELASAVRRVAGGLSERGFAKGDVLAIYSPNLPEYAVAFHAVASIGGSVTTANPLLTAPELARQLHDSRARHLLTIGPLLGNATEAAKGRAVEALYTFDGAQGSTPFSSLIEADEIASSVDIDPKEDVVVLPYSSGTTGLPKGVMLTHHNLVANLCQVEGVTTTALVTEGDVALGVLPFFHIYGLLVIMNRCLCSGATVVTMPRFDMEQFLSLIERYRVNYAPLVPPIVLGLAKHPAVDAHDLSSLRTITCGAAPIGLSIASEAAKRLDCVIAQGYGLTETSPVTHIAPNVPGALMKLGSIGPCVPNTEARVTALDTGNDLGPGEQGEILIRGPQVMKGYLNRPDATAASIDGDGWFRTGDVGYADEDGFFYIVDRVKELIKYNAYQVAPAELEAVLLTHPDIADAAVIGSPDEETGEVPKAFVVLHDSALDADAIMGYVAERVAPYKKIRRVEFIDEIPKAPSGKILRRILVERERSAVDGR